MTLTESELEQRQQASRKHGFYAVQARGVDAMTTDQRGRLVEILEDLSTENGLKAQMISSTAMSCLLAEIIENTIVDDVRSGIPLQEQPLLARVATFQGERRRSLKQLYDLYGQEAQDTLNDLLGGDDGNKLQE